MRPTRVALCALALFTMTGCSIAYDRYGNPAGAGFFVATAEKPTTIEQGVSAAEDVAWMIDPKLGAVATLIAGAFGLGKREERKATDRADRWYVDGQKDGLLRQAPPVVNQAEVSS